MVMHGCGLRPQLICEGPKATNTDGDLHWSVGPAKGLLVQERGGMGGGLWGGGFGANGPYLVCWRVACLLSCSGV